MGFQVIEEETNMLNLQISILEINFHSELGALTLIISKGIQAKEVNLGKYLIISKQVIIGMDLLLMGINSWLLILKTMQKNIKLL